MNRKRRSRIPSSKRVESNIFEKKGEIEYVLIEMQQQLVLFGFQKFNELMLPRQGENCTPTCNWAFEAKTVQQLLTHPNIFECVQLQ